MNTLKTFGALVAVVVVLSIGVSACSLTTSSADITVKNTWPDADVVEVDGRGKTINANSDETWTVEWDGLGEKDYKIEIYDYPGGPVWAKKEVTVNRNDEETVKY